MSARRIFARPARLAAIAPYLWMVLFFLVPFGFVLKISLSQTAIAQPPYTPVFDFTAGRAALAAAFAQLSFDNFRLLVEQLSGGGSGGGVASTGCTAWNSRGADMKCSCASAGFGNSGRYDSGCAIGCGIAARGISIRGGSIRDWTGSGAGGAGGGAVRTERRSVSIIARRSTTWPSVL